MFYTTSKLFWVVASPQTLFALLIAVGTVLLARGKARAIAFACFTIAALAALIPVGSWALQPLENQYPRPALPAHVDGILVLGGGLGPKMLVLRGVNAPEPAILRLVAAAELARRYSSAKLVFSGGNGDAANAFKSDAWAARAIFAQLGLSPQRVQYEDRARNTAENFLFSRPIAQPRPGETWMLITSAYHMPRSMAVARKQDWAVIPWASDYRTEPGFSFLNPDLQRNLALLDLAMHEWVGLVAYHASGRAI